MFLTSFRPALAVAALLFAAPAVAERHAARISAVAGELYAVEGHEVLLHLPRCAPALRGAEAEIDLAARAVWLAGASHACAIHRMLRPVTPAAGRYDLTVAPAGPSVLATPVDGWVFVVEGCDGLPNRAAARLVIDGAGDRLLVEAPDHPAASITGRVTCAVRRVLTELRF